MELYSVSCIHCKYLTLRELTLGTALTAARLHNLLSNRYALHEARITGRDGVARTIESFPDVGYTPTGSMGIIT